MLPKPGSMVLVALMAASTALAGNPDARTRERASDRIVHIEEDLIVGVGVPAHEHSHVDHPHVEARIVERVAVETGERATIPRDHGRHQLRHGDAPIVGQATQGRSRGEAHTQPTDEDALPCPTPLPLARDVSQGVLGSMCTTVHQLVEPGANGKTRLMLPQV